MEKLPQNARLLLAPSLAATLRAAWGDHVQQRVTRLTNGLAPASGEAGKKIDEFLKAWPKLPHDTGRGAEIFKAQCALCHQLGQIGSLVGPCSSTARAAAAWSACWRT